MGSDSKTNGSGSGGDGGQIPASVKKVVQNLKEIVNNNCTDSEIYAVLRECNMDPNDAVQRLLSQDTFHEVKRRRERRKEMKETQEVKTRANHGTSNHGGSEHSFGQSGSIQCSSNGLGKATYRKQNGSVASIPCSASSTLCATGQTWNEQPFPQSNCFNADNGRQSIGTGDMIDSSLQPSPGSQSTWVGATLGHVSMADIVRMGGPQTKGSQTPCETSNTPQDAVPSNSAIYQIKPSLATSPSQFGKYQDLHSSNLNITRESGKKSSHHDFDNEWLVNDLITASRDIGATMYSNQSYLHINIADLSTNCWSDNILALDSNAARENLSSANVSSDQASNKQIFMNDFGGTSEHVDDLCKDTSSPDSYQQIYEPQEGKERGSNISVPNPTASFSDDAIKAVSVVGVKLQQLSLEEEPAVTPTEDNRGLLLPNYLQAFSADCSHLSFGTYKSGKKALSQPQAFSSLKNDLEEALTTSNGCPSSTRFNSRDLVYHNEEQLEFDVDTRRAIVDSRKYNPPNFLRAELRKIDIHEAAAHGNDYVSHLSIPGSTFKNIQQLSSALSSLIDPNARNLPPLPNEVQSRSNSIPSDLLPANIQSIKARDSAAFIASQSVSSRYSSSVSSIKNPTASMSEALLGANLATGSVLKDNFSAYSGSQTDYPAITQGHTYTPSALQQAYPDRNVFHESHTAIKYSIPHYGARMNSLPLSGSYTAYQSLEKSADIPESFLHNLSSGPAGSTVGYDDCLCTQYRNGGANLIRLQQNGGTALRAYGHGSRTISTIPDSAYYSLQGQNHQLAGYQQGQQHSQPQGALGYPGINSYQAGITIEQQQQHQQNLHDMIINGSQGSSSNQLPQIWQHSY